MNSAIEMFNSVSKAKELKTIRVFVKGEYNKYATCSNRALENARKHDTNVKVTFTSYKLDAKKVISLKTVEEYIPNQLIK